MPNTTSSFSIRRAAHLAAVAAVLAVAFRASVQSQQPDADDLVRQALQRGADRLVALQLADGLFPAGVAGDGDLASSGRSARALVVAWRSTHDGRHLLAARRAAAAIVPTMAKDPATLTAGNLLLAAEVGQACGDAELVRAAHAAWSDRVTATARRDPAGAGRRYMARPNETTWLDGDWRNYLLATATDEVELARLVGENRFADEFAVGAASSWAPKHDYGFWASATGGMVLALAGSERADARRLRDVELDMLRLEELAPGIPWNDTPYDTFVYGMETATAIRGLAASGDGAALAASRQAAAFVVMRQASHGGWGATLALHDQVANEGSSDVPAAELAWGETAELDAQIVMALAEVLSKSRDRRIQS